MPGTLLQFLPEATDFADQIITNAFNKSASDIHLEPGNDKPRIRFRINGNLKDINSPPWDLFNALISHLKIRANLNIAEKRLPQDGRITFNLSQQITIDLRVSSIATLFGEKIVLRLLGAPNKIIRLNQLGMSPNQQFTYQTTLSEPQGLIILSGPTGCGKTTTLYAGLQFCNDCSRNIYTIEDPIEITLDGINQINVNPAIGLSFKQALKALLRQDPDIIMLGEIRDAETANIAIHAAQTGHLVLTTLHSASPLESILRLQQLGVNRFNLLESLKLIINQKLILKPNLSGRTGIFEMLSITKKTKKIKEQLSPLGKLIQ